MKYTKIFLAFLLILNSTISYSQLSGLYTIGNLGDYSSLKDAVIDLGTKGMNGPVTFTYLPNTLDTTPVTFPNGIIGLSATDSLLIQSSQGSRTRAKLHNRDRNNQLSYMIDCSLGHVTFNNLEILADTNYGDINACIILGNGSILNSIIRSPTTYLPVMTVMSNSTIRNCTVEGDLGTGILIQSSSSNVLITENSIRGYFPTGIYSANGKHNTITKNIISGPKKMTTAISMLRADSVYITKNDIQEYADPRSMTRFIGTGIETSVSKNCFIQNNMVNCEGTAYRQHSGNDNRIEHNTFYDSRDSAGQAVVNLTSVAGYYNNYFRNNIVAAKHGNVLHLQLHQGYPDYFKSMDYNDWHSYGSQLTLSIQSPTYNKYHSIVAWTAATQRDSNSVSEDPKFVIPPDLHITSTSIKLQGLLLPYIVDDFDGDQRGLATSVMGADQVQLISTPEFISNSAKLRIYPNPCQSEIWLDLPSSLGNVEIQVVDITGKVHINAQAVSYVDVGELSPGYYYINASNGKQHHYSGFIKQ